MSTSFPDDLALSITFVPSTGHTYAVVYGCNPEQTQTIVARLRAAGDYIYHPLLIAGIFAELERQRLIAAADNLVDRFASSSITISGDTQWDPNSSRIKEYFSTCLKSRNLVDQIRAVKRQLASFVAEVDGLERQWRSQLSRSKKIKSDSGAKTATDKYDEKRVLIQEENWTERIKGVIETGRRIKSRLADINVEYDDKIDECEMIAQNLPLAMQTVSEYSGYCWKQPEAAGLN